MATQKQIDANRRNSQKSTGPTTDEGKKISRLNAMKHGLYGKDFSLDIEDPEHFRNYHYQLLLDWDPQTAAELILIEQAVRSHFLSRRYAAHMPDLYLASNRGGKPVIETYPILMKMIHQADRTTQRALEQLAQIKRDRERAQAAVTPAARDVNAEEREPLLNLPDPPDLNDLAAALDDSGFVSPPPVPTRSPQRKHAQRP